MTRLARRNGQDDSFVRRKRQRQNNTKLDRWLDRPDMGEILIDSESTQNFNDAHWNKVRRNKIGLVFQQYHLVPTLTVADNLKLQARLTGRLNLELFDFLESKLGLNGLSTRLPHQLSGGQQLSRDWQGFDAPTKIGSSR